MLYDQLRKRDWDSIRFLGQKVIKYWWNSRKFFYAYCNRFNSLACPFFFTLCTPTWAYFSKTTFDLCQGLWGMFLSPTTRLVILTVLFHSHVISDIWNAVFSRPLITFTCLDALNLLTEVLKSTNDYRSDPESISQESLINTFMKVSWLFVYKLEYI